MSYLKHLITSLSFVVIFLFVEGLIYVVVVILGDIFVDLGMMSDSVFTGYSLKNYFSKGFSISFYRFIILNGLFNLIGFYLYFRNSSSKFFGLKMANYLTIINVAFFILSTLILWLVFPPVEKLFELQDKISRNPLFITLFATVVSVHMTFYIIRLIKRDNK